MLFALTEKGQGLVEYALILRFGCHRGHCSFDGVGSNHWQRLQFD